MAEEVALVALLELGELPVLTGDAVNWEGGVNGEGREEEEEEDRNC